MSHTLEEKLSKDPAFRKLVINPSYAHINLAAPAPKAVPYMTGTGTTIGTITVGAGETIVVDTDVTIDENGTTELARQVALLELEIDSDS
jgi:hypothetical protein